jgi:hypothetical protein
MMTNGAFAMNRRSLVGVVALGAVLCSVAILAYQRWSAQNGAARGDALALMPPDASAVLFADFSELRRAPFFAQLYAWAPKPPADADYAEFLKNTGFDYERDLDRVAIALEKRGDDSILFAIADGKFDREKITAYARKIGSTTTNGGRETFSVPVSGSPRKISLTFLSKKRIALTDNVDLAVFLSTKKTNADAAEWRGRFERLAGSPVFAVIRQGAGTGSELAAQAPGGLRSPQLSALLDQLQWITLAGKPENDGLRVVAEGECTAEAAARQLSDLLNGVMILAQAGLNDARTRQQLDPAAREAYLELLKSANVTKIDRGDTKSVRVILEITPKFLEAARTSPSTVPPAEVPPNKSLPQKSTAQKKGHT